MATSDPTNLSGSTESRRAVQGIQVLQSSGQSCEQIWEKIRERIPRLTGESKILESRISARPAQNFPAMNREPVNPMGDLRTPDGWKLFLLARGTF